MKIDELINKYYNNLSENDKLICKYIMKNKDTCYKLSIDKFSSECHVSKTMLFRFAKKISISGFSELKVRLRWEAENNNSCKTNFLSDVTDSYHKMIEDFKNRDCNSIFQKLYQSKRILVYGSGYAQARVASEFKRIFLPVRQNIFYIHGYDMVESLVQLSNLDDFVIIISLSGESRSVIHLAEKLRLKQIPALSITRMKNNTLASLCYENLYINSITLPTNYMLDYEISTPYFILIELLFLKYQNFLCEIQYGQNFIK